MLRLTIRISLVIGALLIVDLNTSEAATKEPLVVFLVRHAEKADASADPPLSAAGTKRAKALADALRDAGVKHIHSSDFLRTRSTAAPLAARLNLKVQLYDAGNLPVLVAKLRQTGGRHLVVGHSNTTPAAVKMLGGKPGGEINEAREYDRLYIVTVPLDGKAGSVLIRYGKPYQLPDPE